MQRRKELQVRSRYLYHCSFPSILCEYNSKYLYRDGSPTVRYTEYLPECTASAIIRELVFHCNLRDSLSFIIGNIRSAITVLDSSMYFLAIARAILGLPSFEVGVKMASALLILSTALTVSKSGSPGPQPTHESFHDLSCKKCVI